MVLHYDVENYASSIYLIIQPLIEQLKGRLKEIITLVFQRRQARFLAGKKDESVSVLLVVIQQLSLGFIRDDLKHSR